jgi:hypothetical protein
LDRDNFANYAKTKKNHHTSKEVITESLIEGAITNLKATKNRMLARIEVQTGESSQILFKYFHQKLVASHIHNRACTPS